MKLERVKLVYGSAYVLTRFSRLYLPNRATATVAVISRISTSEQRHIIALGIRDIMPFRTADLSVFS